jgi:hypothetical protein
VTGVDGLPRCPQTLGWAGDEGGEHQCAWPAGHDTRRWPHRARVTDVELIQYVEHARRDLMRALQLAGQRGVRQRDLVHVLMLPMNTVGSLNRCWNLDLFR